MSEPVYLQPDLPDSTPYIALVRTDGEEWFVRHPWLGTHLDAESGRVFGFDVVMVPPRGRYDRYRIYSRRGTLQWEDRLPQVVKVTNGAITLSNINIILLGARSNRK